MWESKLNGIGVFFALQGSKSRSNPVTRPNPAQIPLHTQIRISTWPKWPDADSLHADTRSEKNAPYRRTSNRMQVMQIRYTPLHADTRQNPRHQNWLGFRKKYYETRFMCLIYDVFMECWGFYTFFVYLFVFSINFCYFLRITWIYNRYRVFC